MMLALSLATCGAREWTGSRLMSIVAGAHKPVTFSEPAGCWMASARMQWLFKVYCIVSKLKPSVFFHLSLE